MTDLIVKAMEQYGDAFMGVVVFVVVIGFVVGVILLLWGKVGKPIMDNAGAQTKATAETALALRDAAQANLAASTTAKETTDAALGLLDSMRGLSKEQRELVREQHTLLEKVTALHAANTGGKDR